MLSIEIYGKSHEKCIGVKAQGLPENEKIDVNKLQEFLNRRKPTTRNEADVPVIISGLHNNTTDGNIFIAEIVNEDVRSSDYDDLKDVPRPGHADYPAYVRSNGEEDLKGGGKFSGRMTAPFCVIGGIAKQILENHGITVSSEVVELYGCRDKDRFEEIINKAKDYGDSIGGIVECQVDNLPIGLGGELFSGLESIISYYVFGIPSVKGIEFGEGFNSSRLHGSENNDQYRIVDGTVSFETNHAGGILGGMSTGQPLIFRCAFKPIPSISKLQHSVNLKKMENVDLKIHGRHDVTAVFRAQSAVESACAVALLSVMDFIVDESLDSYRKKVDEVDRQISALLEKRYSITDKIGKLKTKVLDRKREEIVIQKVLDNVDDKYGDEIKNVYTEIMTQSKKRQEKNNG